MARHAICRDLVLHVTVNAVPHRQVHRPHRHRLLTQIAVAFRARHARPNMRRVIEKHMSLRHEPVHPLPWHVLAFVVIRRQFLDSRFVFGDHPVAGHAELRAGNPRIRPLIHARVAHHALQSVRDVNIMRELDRLDRLRTVIKKFGDRVANGTVCRCKNRRRFCSALERARRIITLRGKFPLQ